MSYSNEKRKEDEIGEGIAYLELRFVSDKRQDGSDLVSKQGEPMLLLIWEATDRFGKIQSVYDYILSSEKTAFKRNNLENAIRIHNEFRVWQKKEGQFNLFMLQGKISCCASIKKELYNGVYSPKIAKYIPLEFLKVAYEVNNKKEDHKDSASNESVENAADFSSGDSIRNDDFDDIPF